ncbi:sialidase family protein [Armatimonas sp.]|uniref:sialidase family protein n=1 Tax=Armatimonas sp. TaxID=1872638 RepID=UPI00286CE703|nr:sialidase family protein [Armatimonas sp.]
MIRLRDGLLLAALRSSKINLHFSTNHDSVNSWGPACDSGFKGHAPQTALHVSRDDGRTWEGPFEIDSVIGAYPSTVELKDGSVLVVYYTEGEGSHIRAKCFRLTPTGVTFLPV